MSKEVKRYSPDTNGRMREWPDGDYVSWDDYDAPRTELSEANADFVRIANERESLLAERDRLLAELERAYANYNQVSYASTERGKQIDQLRVEVEGLRKALEQFADDGNWCYDTCSISRDVAKDALVAKDETP